MVLPLALGVGRFAMQAIPYIAGVTAAMPALREGRPIEAAVQGGLGYLTGGALKGGVGALTKAGMRAAPGMAGRIAPNLVDAPGFAQTAARAARIGIPLAGLALTPKIASAAQGLVGGATREAAPIAGPAAQTALGYGAYRETPLNVGAGLPPAYDPNMGMYGGTTPYGLPASVLGQEGLGRTLESQRQAKAEAEALKILKPIEMAYVDEMRRRELSRLMAAAGVRQNIQTQAAMLQNAQTAAINLGQTTGEGISRSLGQPVQYA